MRKLFYISLGILILAVGIAVTNAHACGIAKQGKLGKHATNTAGNLQTSAPMAPIAG